MPLSPATWAYIERQLRRQSPPLPLATMEALVVLLFTIEKRIDMAVIYRVQHQIAVASAVA